MGSEARLRPLPDYGVAALATGVALVLQIMLTPRFGGGSNSSPFMMVFDALLVASGGINQPQSNADRAN